MKSEREPTVFGYGRASSRKQVDSPETQKSIIAGYAEFNKLGDVTYFVDNATSGKITWEDRDAGKELWRQLRPGDHIVIAKLDRAFRRLADCVVVLEKLRRMEIKLHICNLMGGAIDLSSPMGVFMIHILAAFAELERAFIAERTRDGMKDRKKRNVQFCNYPGYGFRWKKVWIDGKLVKVKERDDEERNVMRSIAQWRMQDQPLSWDEIRTHLTYTLKLRTKEGKLWDLNRIKRACRAEFILQLQEGRGNR